MDTKKFQRATEIMNELKSLHESLENIKMANKLTFNNTSNNDVWKIFFEKSQTFIACRDIAICEAEKRIAQLEKEFNDL